MSTKRYIVLLMLSLALVSKVLGARFLFDSTCIPSAGNADWVIDAPMPDACTLSGESFPERFPSPSQCLVTPDTPETFWNGAFSAWGIALVRAGHWVETLPRNGRISYHDCENPQDLSFYDVFISPEPQTHYTERERDAILEFVAQGGGLFLIGDHCGSDRNQNGYDSPLVFEEMETDLYFGIEFQRGDDVEPHYFCDWDEPYSHNFSPEPDDAIIRGPFGIVQAIGFHDATSLVLHPENNPSVTAHAWRNGAAHSNTDVTVATSEFGSGRVAAIGDSSPADDGTGDPRDRLYNGWSHYTTDNDILFMNISEWLCGGTHPPEWTPCATQTPLPGCTPSPFPTPPPSTPTPEPTPVRDPIVRLFLNDFLYSAGDPFILKVDIENPGPARAVDFYLILQLEDRFYFYPSWSDTVDYQRKYLSQGDAFTDTIFDFTWPAGAGHLDGLIFWAAFINPQTHTLIGNYDSASFSAY